MPDLAESSTTPLEQTLATRIFDFAKPPAPVVPVFTLGGVVVSTPGNLTVINAAVKTGKSALIGAFIASTMSADEVCDTLGVESSNPDGKAVIHIDTEQSIEDHWAVRSCGMSCRWPQSDLVASIPF